MSKKFQINKIFINKKMKDLNNKISKILSKILKENDEVQMWSDIINSEDLDDNGGSFFDTHKDKFKRPLRPGRENDEFEIEEDNDAETEEGNAFSGALNKAKEEGDDSFEVDGKKYHVKESEDKWIQKMNMKKGSLHKELGIPEDQKIPKSKLMSLKKDLQSKSKGDKKLSSKESKLLKQVNLALNLKDIKESKSSVLFTEEELISIIENIVNEAQEVEKVKKNITEKTPQGLNITNKSLGKSKKINDDNIKQVTKKIKDYVKSGSNEEYTTEPKHFPKNNGQLKAMDKKAYKPSEAVEEYIENLSSPGLQNLTYDEIKPKEEWLDDNILGSSKTGNNSDWANSEKTGYAEKLNQVRKNNYYGKEKERSYNRVKQPVDVSGESKDKKSNKKLDSIFAKLESTEGKTTIIQEEIDKMKKIYSYNKKTQ